MNWSNIQSLNHDIISIALFFTMLVVGFAHTWWERRRLKQAVAHPQRTAPIGRTRISRKKTLILSITLVAFGLHAAIFDPVNAIYSLLLSIVGFFGVFLLLMLLTGRAATSWIEIRPDMIASGSFQGHFTVARSNIEGWYIAEVGSNQVLLIRLKNVGEMAIFAKNNREKYEARIRKGIQKNESWVGAHIYIMLGMYEAPADRIVGTMLQLYGDLLTLQSPLQ